MLRPRLSLGSLIFKFMPKQQSNVNEEKDKDLDDEQLPVATEEKTVAARFVVRAMSSKRDAYGVYSSEKGLLRVYSEKDGVENPKESAIAYANKLNVQTSPLLPRF